MIKIVIGLLLLFVQTASSSQKQSKITTALIRVPRRELTDEDIAHLCPQKGGRNCVQRPCETDDDCSGYHEICCPYIRDGETEEEKCCVDPPEPKPGCLEVYDEIEDCPPCTTHDDCTDCLKCCYNRKKGMCCQKLTSRRSSGVCPVNLDTPEDCKTCRPFYGDCHYSNIDCCLAGDSLCCTKLLTGPCPENPDPEPNCQKCTKDEDCTAFGKRCCPVGCENCCIPLAVSTDGCKETYEIVKGCQSCQEQSECDFTEYDNYADRYGLSGGMACCAMGDASKKCCLRQSYYPWLKANYYCPLVTKAPTNCIKCDVEEEENKCPEGTQCCSTRTYPCCLPYKNMTSGCVDLVRIPDDCEYCKGATDCKDGKICCEVGPAACCIEPSGKPGCGLIAAPPEVCKKCSSDSDCVLKKETCCSVQAREKSCCIPTKEKVNAVCKPDYGYSNCPKCIFDSDCNGTHVCCPFELQGCCIDPLDPYSSTTLPPSTTENLNYVTNKPGCPNRYKPQQSCIDCAETRSCSGNGEKCCITTYGDDETLHFCCIKIDATSTGAMTSTNLNVYLLIGCSTILFQTMLT